tara:strand:+ start:1201 stop:2889 length:1689 start_codon:yes stop_codon:yes gene_type:complete
MSIEILENTLIKLLVRRGTDNDRTNITLENGELGYTTDTQRLYIGDATTKGGLIVGNKYQGQAADITTLAPCVTGDYGFETDTNTLKVLIGGNGSNEADWLKVSNLLSAGNTTINIGTDNLITVGTLSAGNFNADALGKGLQLDGSNRISLSSTISIDQIIRETADVTSYLTLPSKLKINAINYDFPGVGPSNSTFLGSDASGNLAWKVPSIIESGVAPTTASVLPVGTIVPFASASNGVPYGWLECDGTQYLSAGAGSYPDLFDTIGTDYNIGGEALNKFRVPNLLQKTLYGYEIPADSTVFPVTTAAHTAAGLSATGMNFIIKAIGGVTAPTLTIGGNLSAFVDNPAGTNKVDKTGVTFNPLSGSVTIEKPAPGQVVFNTQGVHTFTFPDGIHFVKYTVTGTGSKGGVAPGGAGATAIGNLSAKPGTEFTIEVGQGFTTADGPVNGNPSRIRLTDGTAIVTADGGIYEGAVAGKVSDRGQVASNIAGGTIDTSNAHVLNGFIINGGSGLIDTDGGGGKEESLGASSYFGNAPAPGGGQGAHSGAAFGPPPSDGVVILEWS